MDARLCTAAASELERAFAGAMTRLRRFSDANLGRRALRPARKGARIRERCFAAIVNGPLMLERPVVPHTDALLQVSGAIIARSCTRMLQACTRI